MGYATFWDERVEKTYSHPDKNDCMDRSVSAFTGSLQKYFKLKGMTCSQPH